MPHAVYISGPMTGLPEFNYPAFNTAAERWRKAGWEALNPAENFGGSQTERRSAYLRADIDMLLRADAIALLDGWEQSRGAKLELLIAQGLGLRVCHADTMGTFPAPDLLVLPVASTSERLDVTTLPPVVEMAVTDGEGEPEMPPEGAQRLVHGDRGSAYGHPIPVPRAGDRILYPNGDITGAIVREPVGLTLDTQTWTVSALRTPAVRETQRVRYIDGEWRIVIEAV